MYSRLGYLAIKEETVVATAVKPTIFVPIMSEDITVEWGSNPAMPVQGKRQKNLRPIDNFVEAPQGSINVLLEPKTLGYFLKGVCGAVKTGIYMTATTMSGDWAIGDTATGGTSAATAVVIAVSTENDYLLVATPTGTFTNGETVTNGSTGTLTLTDLDTSVFGHEFEAPQTSLPTFTIEIGYESEAIRYVGVTIKELSELAQSDNIMTAQFAIQARYAFQHARVTETTTAGAGSKTITVDQTSGLIVADTIKVFREGTGYLDFSAASTKTHAIGTVASETSFTVTNVETEILAGDLIVLAPQTSSYSVNKEFSWIGGSKMALESSIDDAVLADGDCIEDFNLSLINGFESKHCADGYDVVNRFPTVEFLMGLEGSGQVTRTYTDQAFIDKLRTSEQVALFLRSIASQIGSTSFNYQIDFRTPFVVFDAYNVNIEEDALLNEEIPFTMYDSPTDGYFQKILLINDNTNY